MNTGEARTNAVLRAQPQSDAASVLSLQQGEDVRIIDYDSVRWVRAEARGVYGYAAVDELYLDYWIATCYLDEAGAPLYAQPSEEAATVGTLSDAQIVTVKRLSDGWAYVRTTAGQEGYCPQTWLNIL